MGLFSKIGFKKSSDKFFATKAWYCSSQISKNRFKFATKSPKNIAPKNNKNKLTPLFLEKSKTDNANNKLPIINGVNCALLKLFTPILFLVN